MSEDVGKGPFGAKGEEDSLLANAELAAGAVSSILRDSDLRKVDALPVEEAVALSLQGVVSVCPYAFVCSSHYCFTLYINFTSLLGRWLPMKSLTRRASLTEGSARVAKAYKAKVASLTSEKVDL